MLGQFQEPKPYLKTDQYAEYWKEYLQPVKEFPQYFLSTDSSAGISQGDDFK